MILLLPRENHVITVITRLILFIICVFINYRTINKALSPKESDNLLDDTFAIKKNKTSSKIRTRIILALIINFILLLSFLEISTELFEVIFFKNRENALNNLYYHLFYFCSVMNIIVLISIIVDILTLKKLGRNKKLLDI